MGLVVLQTAQNLLKTSNSNILNDFMTIEKICQLQPTCVEIFPVPALFEF